MKQFFGLAICAFFFVQLVGCAVRTSTSTKPRVDQEIAGNRGFISGKPSTAPKEPTFSERKVYTVEVELPAIGLSSAKKSSSARVASEDKEVWGNQGYLFKKEVGTPLPTEKTEQSAVAKIKEKITEILTPEKAVPSLTYEVQKGDTLQKISRKFFGTTKKWPLLYKANRDKLKSPDQVYPGQVLVVPEVSEFKK